MVCIRFSWCQVIGVIIDFEGENVQTKEEMIGRLTV
jgi:hypothetical protein